MPDLFGEHFDLGFEELVVWRSGEQLGDQRLGAIVLNLRFIKRFGIKVGSASEPVATLSGGNQQKVVVSRSLDQTPGLLVAMNPTRGLDFQSTETVHRLIREARDAGVAVALVSTDLDELSALASRTVFLSRGRVVEGSDATAVVGGAE